MRSVEYDQHLKSAKWNVTRSEIIIRDGGMCTQCGATTRLDVHHITYRNLGHEPLTDLVTLCRSCHDGRHGKATARIDPNQPGLFNVPSP